MPSDIEENQNFTYSVLWKEKNRTHTASSKFSVKEHYITHRKISGFVKFSSWGFTLLWTTCKQTASLMLTQGGPAATQLVKKASQLLHVGYTARLIILSVLVLPPCWGLNPGFTHASELSSSFCYSINIKYSFICPQNSPGRVITGHQNWKYSI